MTTEQVLALLAMLADQHLQIGRLTAENEMLRQAVVAAQTTPEMAE